MEMVHEYLDRLSVRKLGPCWDYACLFRTVMWTIHDLVDNHRLNPKASNVVGGTFEEAESQVAYVIKAIEEFLDYTTDKSSMESFERFKSLETVGCETNHDEIALVAYNLLDDYISRQDPARHDFLTRASYERTFGPTAASN